jgi:hypothetical protein
MTQADAARHPDPSTPLPAAEDFDYGEACLLLGGGEVAELLVARAASGRDGVPGARVLGALAHGRQWWFAGDPRWGLEVLHAKLGLFLDVVEAAAAAGAAAGAPGSVEEADLSASFRGGMPARWQLRAFLRPRGGMRGAAATGSLGLGPLLLRTLLVHGEQPLEALLRLFTAGAAPADDRLATRHLLHRAADRAAAGAQPLVPDAIWSRVLQLVGRLLQHEPPLPELAGTVQALRGRIEVELFHGQECRAAIAAACAAVQSATALAPGGVEAPDAGFRLLVRRSGEAAVQELSFDVDRVTIGRREGENLLRLADPMVSSSHAVIERTPDGFAVSDCNSTNGTEVDGIRLPVEVAQPLRDGSVIVIQPFRLEFRRGLGTTAVGPSAAALRERLAVAFAERLGAPPAERRSALDAVLQQARRELPGALFGERLSELADGPVADGGVASAAARALAQLARALLGVEAVGTAAEAQAFAGRLGRFVEATSRGIERLLELKRALGRHLELDLAATTTAQAPVRAAADVRRLTLDWTSDAVPADASAWYLAKFFDDLGLVLVNLLQGSLRTRRAVRDRLEPARLVALAAHDERLRSQVQAAAKSALWQFYKHAFDEVTAGSDGDAELQAAIERALRTGG